MLKFMLVAILLGVSTFSYAAGVSHSVNIYGENNSDHPITVKCWSIYNHGTETVLPPHSSKMINSYAINFSSLGFVCYANNDLGQITSQPFSSFAAFNNVPKNNGNSSNIKIKFGKLTPTKFLFFTDYNENITVTGDITQGSESFNAYIEVQAQ